MHYKPTQQWMEMPNNEGPVAQPGPASNAPESKPPSTRRGIFDLPAPLRRIFDTFPIREYPANDLPIRAPKKREEHVLYIFTSEEDAKLSRPSYNPGCLKWQAYLRFSGLSFRTTPSSNHASPSGTLPFLQPASLDTAANSSPQPVPSNRLKKWLKSQAASAKAVESSDLRYEAYASLVDNRIRKAWLYQLYLAPQNAEVMHRLYVANCSSQGLVQMTIASQLRAAAEAELVKSAAKNIISTFDLMKEVEEAFEALATLLGGDKYFFGQDDPGLFDASVFAYTELILDRQFGWKHNPLQEHLSKHENLIQHRNNIHDLYF